jgi:hypothetical protein
VYFSLSINRSPVLICQRPSSEPVAEKVQQLPQAAWSFTLPTEGEATHRKEEEEEGKKKEQGNRMRHRLRNRQSVKY